MEGRCVVSESVLRNLLSVEKRSKKRGKQRKLTNEDKEEIEVEVKRCKLSVEVDLAARLYEKERADVGEAEVKEQVQVEAE